MLSTTKHVTSLKLTLCALFGLATTFAATACDVGRMGDIDAITQPTEHSTAQAPPCNHKNPSKKNSGQCPKPPGQE